MTPQDSFIDEEDDACPLCIEEFDIQDKKFHPCPCGYQICQFCYNNLKNNLNGLCPACRRPYDESTMKFEVVTPEQIAEFRANIQKNQKKRAAERQKETQKREVTDRNNRKNLVGVRVVQKNLVYVTGLTPTVPEDELLKTLRKHEFFGQYGNIQKISISNRKAPDGQPQSLGIYVTFEKKEDAARCIAAVNGSHNGDRVLRAQLGTTKYCSAWLRNEQCSNRQCMFLHELGDEEDSYTRQDLSSLNSVHTQRPLSNAPGSSRSASRQQGEAHPPPLPIAQTMVRTSSKEGSEIGDGPMLPASANWARTTQQRSRRGSHATSGAASSPAISNALPVTTESAQEAVASTPPPPEEPAVVRRKTEKEKQPAAEPKPKEVPAVKKKPRDPFALPPFSDVLKRLAACPDFQPMVKKPTDDLFPPLFDIHGGRKRRAMREEEEKESRLQEQEEQPEIPEASEGEPESGSHALGGEPEDRDQTRRNPAPIQRTSTDGLFGPSLASTYAQGSSNVGSIGSRSMTPQHFVRPQGSFADQVPPGISAPPSSLFQGQGHTRQQSRFSFANENASGSTKVNLAANPRLMAQQSSMMPSTFHSQPGSQFYASSMPGPPPGLKSTGTPPVSGGMFGQGHGFGGSGFGAASKDNSAELLQSLIRGRQGAGSSHAQDAGKREYFSFANQYPASSTSSTPAPASGPAILASLYASQPGAFQDFGPKQKKKGKKHRHANTSSSGGSALVDLADPSILQARMQQHQQQGSNAGVGQGLFGGQSQDDELLPLDEYSVDALVADSDPEPLEFGGSLFGRSRTTTPAPPPGLGFATHALSPIQFGEISSVVPSVVPHSPAIARPQPAVPRPITPATPVTPVTPLRSKAGPKRVVREESTPSSSKKTIKELAVESGLARDIASHQSKALNELKEEDFPALDSVKGNSPPRVTPALPAKATPSVKGSKAAKVPAESASKSSTVKTPATPSTPARAEKRPTPGVLDIAAATRTVIQTRAGANATADSKGPAAAAATTASSQAPKSVASSTVPTPTLTTASVASPLARAAPKTLRLVQTPRTEAPPIIPPAAVSSIRTAAAAAAARPGTPASEGISDSASVVSASVSASRTSSPPPSKIGSAALRTTTKSQQRKQRTKANKEAAAAIIAESKPVENEVEVAPIEGRKKKQKKEKKPKPSSSASPAVSRPDTPLADSAKSEAAKVDTAAETAGPAEEKAAQKGKGTKPEAEMTAKSKDTKGKEPKERSKSPQPIDTSIRLNESTKTTVLTPDYVQPNPEPRQEAVYDGAVGEVPSLSEILQSLIEEGELPDPDEMNLFKPLPNYRAESDRLSASSLPPTVKSVVTKDDEAELNAFRPVRKDVNGHRVLLTPNGDFVLNLTEEEEDRFLELQARVAGNSGDATAFMAPKNTPGTGFSLIKGRAVPNGLPSFFPPGASSFPSDPVGKMHREEAIGCINQHVLPSLNLGSYKSNSSFPNNANSVNLQSLAPWITGAAGAPIDSKDSKRTKGNAMFGAHPGESSAWDDVDDLDGEGSPSPAIGSTPLMSVEEAESVLSQAKKQHEATDKKFKQSMAKMRRQFGLH